MCIYIQDCTLCSQNAPCWAKVRKLFRSSREPCCSPRGVHSMFKLNWFRIWPLVPFSNQDALPSLSGSAFADSHSPKGGDDDQKGHCWLRRALLCRASSSPSRLSPGTACSGQTSPPRDLAVAPGSQSVHRLKLSSEKSSAQAWLKLGLSGEQLLFSRERGSPC